MPTILVSHPKLFASLSPKLKKKKKKILIQILTRLLLSGVLRTSVSFSQFTFAFSFRLLLTPPSDPSRKTEAHPVHAMFPEAS